MEYAWYVLGGVIILGIIVAYNQLTRKSKYAEEGWHSIDVQLKRRYDLIPRLVEAAKGYAKHEAQVLEQVVALRNGGASTDAEKNGQSSPEKRNMEAALSISEQAEYFEKESVALRSFLMRVEAYPDLRGNTAFVTIQKNLAVVEDALQNARRYYNATVREYNTVAAIFPCNIVALIFGFKQKEYFSIKNEKERESAPLNL